MEIFGNILRVVGLFVVLPGLWFSAGGMRVVVSGRIDERKRSANSLKRGLPLLAIGLVMFIVGTYLVNLAQTTQ